MGFFAFARDGRVIAACLGVATIGLVTTIRLLLENIRDQNEVKPHQPKTQYITQETEDSLKLQTLESLLRHYNFAIRETAAKIICDRALNEPECLDYLLYGITRLDYDERMRSLRTLALITDQHSLHVLNTPKAFSALVRSLELSVGEVPYHRLDDIYYDDYYLRDMSEKFCLMFLIQLINNIDSSGVEKLLRAGFVEKWLVRQAWGETDEERWRTFAQYTARHHNRVSEICERILASHSGRRALERAGLLPPGSTSNQERVDNHNDTIRSDCYTFNTIILSVQMGNQTEEGTAATSGNNMQQNTGSTFQPRVREQSAEEQRLRRQHREAMVLNDGTRPLGRGDIIERGRD